MATDRFRKLRDILAAARRLPPEQRDAYLTETCGDDHALREEAAALLAHDDSGESLLATGGPVAHAESDLLKSLGDDRPERIGPYRILAELGRGGMGVVYRAEQREPIQREVALKLIKRGMDTDRVVARFESERQTLALMDHPHIARVLDAGADDRGRPFFVMEFVQGRGLVRFCDSERLTTQRRLDLFLDICRGVQHAHQKGVIHRDLKPSNILVSVSDDSPLPKIIDFGIAKAMNPEGDEISMHTVAGQIIGTPTYMSPEQAGTVHADVDTRADVYSLGVILYELLTGHRPYTFETPTPDEIARVFRDVDPAKPSTIITTEPDDHVREEIIRSRHSSLPGLRRELSGDLDNIVMMAMHKDPELRYPSVDALAEDIRRYQTGMPVRARPDTWRYRTGKFVTRHKVGVGVAAAGVAVLIAFAITTSLQSTRVARERDRAVVAESRASAEATRASAEAETAHQVSEFMVGLFEVSDPSESRGNTVTAREILDRGLERIGTELQDQPRVRAEMMDAMGRTYQSLGLYEQSEPLLTDALEIRESEYGAYHVKVAESLIHTAFLLRDLGRPAEARPLVERALTIQRTKLGAEHPDVTESLWHLASITEELGDLERAEPLYREILELDRRLLGEDDPYIPADMNNLASILHQQGKLDDAEALYLEALELHRKAYGDVHPEIATTLANYSNMLLTKGDVDAAIDMGHQAMDMRLQVLGRDHPHTAIAIGNLGSKYHTAGDLDRAESLLRESLEIRVATQGPRHPSTAHGMMLLGRVLADQGNLEEAELMLIESIDILLESFPEGHHRVARSLTALAMVRTKQNRHAEAESLLEESYVIVQESLPEGHRDIATTMGLLGENRMARGRGDEAEPLLRGSYDILLGQLGLDHRSTKKAATRLVVFYESTGRPTQAQEYRALAN